MKWQKFEAIRKQYPWIKRFVGTLEMNTNRKNDIWDKNQEVRSFRDWVKNNLDCICFRSLESLKEFLKKDNYVAYGLELDWSKNIYYPHWSYGVCYILYHGSPEDITKPFSAKHCLDHGALLGERMKWLKNHSPEKSIVLDGVIVVTWSARAATNKVKQRMDIWLLPENFTPRSFF
jgi:hypothetical protein